ncbi:DUF3014 domain-containing protein [Pseudoalteromonas spongiae]|uniref:DUF3014 domain-containing protein n=1 Tax=Pseudoalteromonas spongiae TaxID=298657 RepID=UPI00110C0E55|nr:DUF3014 domain-containing protein [Pseudoalteromonas spongiae]TMO84968.1 DUF3014 domain-containing protein [Pseudoalteromonas spongiae]
MTTNSQNKLPYIVGLSLVAIVIAVAAMQLMKGDKPVEPGERQVIELPQPTEPVETEQETQIVTNDPVIEPVVEQVVVTKEPEVEEPVSPEVTRVLPSLDDSDSVVRESLADVVSVNLLKLVVSDDLIRRAVVYTENLADGKLAKKHQMFVAPKQPFSVNDGAIITVNPESFERYDPYVSLFTKLSEKQIIALIDEYKPLIQDAYDEIGLSDYEFEQRLALAIQHLLDTPAVPLDTPLTSQSVTYKYAVPEYEALSDAQKQLLRLGPDNMAQVKTKLSRLLKQL